MGDSRSDRESGEGRQSRSYSNRADGSFRDVYKSPIVDALGGSLSRLINPQTTGIHDATRVSSLIGKLGAGAFQPPKSSAIGALASGAFATQGVASANFGLTEATRGILGIGSMQAANASALSGILGSSVNASIAGTLAESMPSFTANLGFINASLSQTNLTKLDGILGLGTFNAATFARLGAWATKAGLDEELLDWSAEVANEDAELESELEAIYALPTADVDTVSPLPSYAEDDARPTTKPLPILEASNENFERSVRVGVALVLCLSIAVVSYIATGIYPFWAVFLAETLGRVSTNVEDNLTKRIVEDLRGELPTDDAPSSADE